MIIADEDRDGLLAKSELVIFLEQVSYFCVKLRKRIYVMYECIHLGVSICWCLLNFSFFLRKWMCVCVCGEGGRQRGR